MICDQVPRLSGASGISSQLQTAQHQQRSSQVCTATPPTHTHKRLTYSFVFFAGVLVFVHAQPAVREAQLLQRPGDLRALRSRGGKHHRHAVLVQRQHRRGTVAQVQQQSHAGTQLRWAWPAAPAPGAGICIRCFLCEAKMTSLGSSLLLSGRQSPTRASTPPVPTPLPR